VFLGFAEWLQATALSAWIQAAGWVIPLLQSVHIVTIGIVFIAILMTVLRMHGRVHREESLATVWDRYAPWLWYGLVVMVGTGVLLIVGEPVRQFGSLSFWLKMLLLASGIAAAIVFSRSLLPSMQSAHADAAVPASTRMAAIATLVLWLTIIFLGRAIGYDIEVWGAWSLAHSG
jgi:uncharacterized membrane protein SirB2